ncbi:hypothetical protein [Candidatus Methylopumilus planktonicus]|uniref:hypothetical protein n=1 Tax=Candidatus Methylopumilus planktonicus TaxID=1581557 RepID=UPI003BEF1193
MMSQRSCYRIAFVNEASSVIGMGHILRSQALARIMSARGHDILGVTIGDKKAVVYAQERSNSEHVNWAIETVHNFKAAIEIILLNHPCVVVVDFSTASKSLVAACKNFGIATVALDYFISEQPLPAAVINLIDHNPASLAGCPLPRPGVAYFEGPQYAIVREEFLVARGRRILSSDHPVPKKIVIAFGGADPSGNTMRAIDMIALWPSEFVVDVIIGPLFTSDLESVTANVRHNCDIILHSSPNYMGRLFEEADIVFCGGGGTLLEALCVGVPTIVLAQNEAESRHAKSLAQRHACWLGEKVNWEDVSQIENRKKLSRSAVACVDGLGAERICNVIEQQLLIK